jgi:hypothetical protein
LVTSVHGRRALGLTAIGSFRAGLAGLVTTLGLAVGARDARALADARALEVDDAPASDAGERAPSCGDGSSDGRGVGFVGATSGFSVLPGAGFPAAESPTQDVSIPPHSATAMRPAARTGYKLGTNRTSTE